MKTIRKTISALLLAGVGITSIQAQNNSPQAWTLRQCIDYAIEHNIEIRQSANNVGRTTLRKHGHCGNVSTMPSSII